MTFALASYSAIFRARGISKCPATPRALGILFQAARVSPLELDPQHELQLSG
jgi:hypothetical protein